MLVAVTEAAVALAEMLTQPGDLHIAEDSVVVAAGKAGHISKRIAVATSEDGGPAGCPQQVDDSENTVFKDRTPGCALDELVRRTDPRPLTWSEAQGSRKMIDQKQRYIKANFDAVHDCTNFEQSDARRNCVGKT